MPDKFKQEVVVVTGGLGLIGKSFVSAIFESGRVAVCADINVEDQLRVSEGVPSLKMDVCDPRSVISAVERVHAEYGRIDGLVNAAYPRNARFGDGFFDVEFDSFCENVNLQLGGYFLTSQKFAEYFKRQGNGSIVNLGSVYGCVAPRFDLYEGTSMVGMPVEYPLIKSSIVQLTKYLAVLLKGSGVRANCISPGGVLDSQPEVFLDRYNKLCTSKGMLDADDLSTTLLYLLDEKSRYINGQNIIVDDGFVL